MKGCAYRNDLNTVIPAVLSAGSPDDILNRFLGQTVTKSVTLNDGAGAKFKSLFTITGAVDIKAIYGIFTRAPAAGVVVVSGCYLDVWDGVQFDYVTSSPGVDCSGATVNSLVSVNRTAGTALTFSKADQVRRPGAVVSSPQLQGLLVNSQNGVATTVRFAVTEDAATNCDITFYCIWAALTPGSTLVAA